MQAWQTLTGPLKKLPIEPGTPGWLRSCTRPFPDPGLSRPQCVAVLWTQCLLLERGMAPAGGPWSQEQPRRPDCWGWRRVCLRRQHQQGWMRATGSHRLRPVTAVQAPVMLVHRPRVDLKKRMAMVVAGAQDLAGPIKGMMRGLRMVRSMPLCQRLSLTQRLLFGGGERARRLASTPHSDHRRPVPGRHCSASSRRERMSGGPMQRLPVARWMRWNGDCGKLSL